MFCTAAHGGYSIYSCAGGAEHVATVGMISFCCKIPIKVVDWDSVRPQVHSGL